MVGTILQVEDDENDVLLLRRAVQKGNLNVDVRSVPDGEKALAYLDGREPYADRTRHPLPDLVLLDLKIPLKSGHEVLAWLRQESRGLKRMPVVVLTSSTEPADIRRAYDLGANSYLVKPQSLDALIFLAKTLDLYWLVLNLKPVLEEPFTSETG